jgi:chemotaxis protein methyltransferase CheR
MAVDLLTTNETYFFRENKHFEFLRAQALASRAGPSLTGVERRQFQWRRGLHHGHGAGRCDAWQAWEIMGTDISTRVLEGARRGLYSMERGRHIPREFLQRFCRKGTEEYDGYLLVDRSLRSRVNFVHANLNAPLPDMGKFDMVFLRNVMIYFNLETKRQVVARVWRPSSPVGYFCIGHSESLMA